MVKNISVAQTSFKWDGLIWSYVDVFASTILRYDPLEICFINDLLKGFSPKFASNSRQSLATLCLPGPIVDIEGMGAFFGAHFSKKGHFVCSHPQNKCHF